MNLKSIDLTRKDEFSDGGENEFEEEIRVVSLNNLGCIRNVDHRMWGSNDRGAGSNTPY